MITRKRALITGATGEIGSAIATMLAKNNIDVILHYNYNQQRISELTNECKSHGVNVHIVQADLSRIEEINQLYINLSSNDLLPNILVNSIGVPHYGLIQDVSFEEWQKVIDTNLMSFYFCTQKFVPEMIKQKDGRIINISSVWGSTGAANEVLYSITKGAINAFTKALAKELAPSNITVNAIAPGIVISHMMKSFSVFELEELKEEIPANRFANPNEIAQLALYLVGDNSAYITGQIINIDGGWI